MATVLGGGVSGLSAAYYYFRRFGKPVTIYEASTRIGGWIRTEQHKDKGFIFETGPRTLRPKGITGANTLQLIEELKLPIESITSTHDAARNRMIYAKGNLCLLPNNFMSLFKKQPPFSKSLFSALLNDLSAKRKTSKIADEPIYDFVERRFGSEVAKYAISPLICGICAGDAKEISVRFLMDDLFEKEQRWGGVTKGIFLDKIFGKKKQNSSILLEPMPTLFERAQKEKWSMYRTENGLETLPRTLSEYLRKHDTKIKLSEDCREIHFSSDKIRMNIKGKIVETKHIIAAVPSYKLAPCFTQQHPSLSALLYAIEYVDVAVVNLQYKSKNLLKVKAFGFLVPPVEKLPILGVIFDSCCFDMNGNTILTVMMGGKWFEEYFGKSPSQKELLDTALYYLNHILNINHEPNRSRVRILKKCIPQYNVGHKQRVTDIRNYIKRYKLPLTLCGAAYDGVGINDVIFSARKQIADMPVPID